MVFNSGADRLCSEFRMAQIRVRQKSDEFFTSEPCGEPIRLCALPKNIADLADNAVAGVMTEGIVDGFEPVDIGHQDRAVFGAGLLFDPLKEGRAG